MVLGSKVYVKPERVAVFTGSIFSTLYALKVVGTVMVSGLVPLTVKFVVVVSVMRDTTCFNVQLMPFALHAADSLPAQTKVSPLV